MPLEELDLSEADAREADAYARATARAPFDLSNDLLLRASLAKTGDASYLLVLVSHHIVYDGWSRTILHRDLAALYEAELHPMVARLPALPIRFADYSAWQRAHLAGATLEKELAYWRGHLAGDVVLELPTDRPRAAAPDFDGARATVVFPRALLEDLERVARAHDLTLYMALLAGFTALMHRYSGQDDVVVATVVAARERETLEHVIGYFASTLALRTSLEGDPTVADLFRRVRDVQLESSEHEIVPIEMLASRETALPNVMFVLQNNAPTALQLGAAELQPRAIDAGTAKFDLLLSMGEMPSGLRAVLQYRTELFDDTTATRVLQHLGVLLEAMVRDQDVRVSALPLLSSAERTQVVHAWNDTAREYPRDATLTSLLAAQAARTPAATAVALAGIAGQTLTFAALDARATTLARALRARLESEMLR